MASELHWLMGLGKASKEVSFELNPTAEKPIFWSPGGTFKAKETSVQRIWDKNEQGEETGTQVIKLEGSPRVRREIQTNTSEKKFWGTGGAPPLTIHASNIYWTSNMWLCVNGWLRSSLALTNSQGIMGSRHRFKKKDNCKLKPKISSSGWRMAPWTWGFFTVLRRRGWFWTRWDLLIQQAFSWAFTVCQALWAVGDMDDSVLVPDRGPYILVGEADVWARFSNSEVPRNHLRYLGVEDSSYDSKLRSHKEKIMYSTTFF